MSQIAAALRLSVPSVHLHVRDMLRSELVREAVGWEKAHPAERYYEPNFPVIKEDEAVELCGLCEELAIKFAAVFKRHLPQFEKAFRNTPLPARGWDFGDIAQYVYAAVQRSARELLEHDGSLVPPRIHRNGVKWIFWAEKPASGTGR